MNYKGIVLAGGSGSRLFPATLGTSKQLLPVYDKPMIYYPLSVLMLAGIREILVICSEHDLSSFRRLLGNGSQWGVELSYEVQPKPGGLAQAFLIGREFLHHSPVALVLGDNLFYGHGFRAILGRATEHEVGSTVFGYHVTDPRAYGVIEFGSDGQPISIVEKPLQPASNFAIPGLYFFDEQVVSISEQLKPSSRGELEITDVLREYMARGQLRVECLSRGFAWVDMGTHDSLLDASNFVASIEKRQGLKIACLEEVAFRSGLLTAEQLLQAATKFPNAYGDYLKSLGQPT
ncbi:MAG TPA: glucose-1-phosphate thymidylyltransferase RfbA [Pirellula sp.]|nr:glucose-1-phosphate thymidylyltransferase RfbA [Pirellula sp.]